MISIPASSKFRILVAMTALLAPISLYSGTVQGTVSDPDELPVRGAKVIILSTSQSTWTDAHGRYSVDGVANGRQSVMAFAEDFEAIELQVEINDSAITEADIRFLQVRKSVTSIQVVGEVEGLLAEIPGSVATISKEELGVCKPTDANEVLRRIPGVTLREDSGPVGMRLNVGIRGLNPDRSRKVLMMEDGIPIALAPYGEPDMYYSPPIDRMRRVEVLKGSGQIIHGPQTVGGVVNFVTPDPPPTTHGSIDVEAGQRGFFVGNASIGGSTRDQSKGWFLNYLYKRGDGFRSFWWDVNDAQGKLTLKSPERHTFGLKFGFYDEKSNSTYLGLTQPQWEQDPTINVVPHDRLVVRRYSGSLTHTMVLSPNAIWNNAFYGYDTVRNWGRQDWDRANNGRDYIGIEGDPSLPGGAVYLRNSAGNRNRQFRVFGGQSGVAWHHTLDGLRGKLDAGIRYINERADDQRVNGDSFDARSGRVRDGEFRYGNATSGYLQERLYFGDRVILTPGFRLEHYNYERDIFRQSYEEVNTRKANSITQAIPGLGLSVKATEKVTFFAGVHQGFAPPRTKIAVTNDGESLDLDAELSWNYEVGVRLRKSRLLQGELTFFRLDFENQIITAAESGGATTTLVNGGETLHQGLESSIRVNWNELIDSSWLIYTDTRYMYMPTAKFTRNDLYQGNRLPYAPRHTFALLIGIRQRQGFGFQVDTSYIAQQFGDNRQTATPSNDGTVGLLPAFNLWNLVADYTVRRERYEMNPYLTVKNLGDTRYIASRAPQGIQPGMLRQVNLGLRLQF